MAPETAAAPPAVQAAAPSALPVLVVGPVEVGRLIRELVAIDEALLQLSLRTGGSEVVMPKTSQLLDQTAELSSLNLLQADDRLKLKQFLVAVRDQAPVLHISFSAEPPQLFIEKLMTWLRREIHPLVLMTVGMQPNIGAGCVVRTTNKYFDCSLRHDFAAKRGELMAALKLAPAPPAAAAVPAEAQP